MPEDKNAKKDNRSLNDVLNAVGLLGSGELLLDHAVEASRAGGNKAEVGSLSCLSVLHEGRGYGGQTYAGVENLGLVLCVELGSDEVGVVLELKDLHALASVVLADEVQAGLGELLDVSRVGLVTVAVSLLHRVGLAVQGAQLGPLAARLEFGRAQAEAHGTAELVAADLGHVDDNLVLGLGVKLLRGGVRNVEEVAGVLDDGGLETKADTEERGTVLTRPLRNLHHTLGTSGTEATGNDDTGGGADIVPSLVVLGLIRGLGLDLEVLGINPADVEFLAQVHRRVLKRLDNGQIGVLRLDVLADKGDVDLTVVWAADDRSPCLP